MVTVDPKVYYNAAKSLNDVANDLASVAKQVLVPGLQAVADLTKGMGGDHPDAAGWNKAYLQHAGDTGTLIAACGDSLQHFGDVLNVCGYNWDTSNFNAIYGAKPGAEPAKPQLSTAAVLGQNDIHIPDPSADNGPGLAFNGSAQKWSGQLLSALTAQGVTFPNGDTDKLNDAAKAWGSFSSNQSVAGAADKIGGVISSFDSIDAPEKPDIVQALQTFQKSVQSIESAAAGIAKAVSAYHDALTALRNSVIQEVPHALPDLMATGNTFSTDVFIAALDSAKPEVITSAAADFAGIVHNSPLFPLLRAASFEGCEGLGSVSDVAGLGTLPLPNESGKSDDNKAVSDAIDATTVASVVDGVNDKGEKTKTITMKDGSKTVATQTTMTDPDGGSDAKPQATVRYDQYDKTGKLMSTTESYKGTDGSDRTTTTLNKDGKETHVLQIAGTKPGDPGTTVITLPDGRSVSEPYQWFSHPYLDGVGGAASGAEQYANDALKALPKTSLISETEKGLDGLKINARFIGPGATIAAGVLDIANGDNPLHAVGSTGAQIIAGGAGAEIGADIGTVLGAAVPVPYLDVATAVAGGVLGGEVGGWMFDKAWKLGG